MEAKNRMVVAKGWERGNGQLLINGYKISVMQDEYILEMCCTTS